MPLTAYFADALLDHVFRGVVYTAPSTVYLGLFSVAPTASTPGTELSGPDYARRATTWAPAADREIRNLDVVEIPEPAGDLGPIVAFGLFDALTAGNLLAYGRILSTTIPAGQPTFWPVGTVTVVL